MTTETTLPLVEQYKFMREEIKTYQEQRERMLFWGCVAAGSVYAWLLLHKSDAHLPRAVWFIGPFILLVACIQFWEYTIRIRHGGEYLHRLEETAFGANADRRGFEHFKRSYKPGIDPFFIRLAIVLWIGIVGGAVVVSWQSATTPTATIGAAIVTTNSVGTKGTNLPASTNLTSTNSAASISSTSSDLTSLSAYCLALVGAIMGSVISAALTHWQWRKKLAAERALLRRNILKSFRFALKGIDQCLGMLTASQPVIPNFKLDAPTVAHLLYTGRDLFRNEATFDAFNWQRYQLDHINAKLDYLHVYHALISEKKIENELLTRECASLIAHLKNANSEIGNLLEQHGRTNEW